MRSRQPLQNRVAPDGTLVAVPERGLFMGNRGGKIHASDSRKLTSRRWASRQWICCVTCFKNRQREVMGSGYTELFFLDEVTALAAGHRPCFECRRADALAFQKAFARSFDYSAPPKADEMDRVLHKERLSGREKRIFQAPLKSLADGTMVRIDGIAHALSKTALLPWSFSGYEAPRTLPCPDVVDVLTPPTTCRVLAEGYQPVWHESSARHTI